MLWLTNLKNNIMLVLGGVATVAIAVLYFMLGYEKKKRSNAEKELDAAEATVEAAKIVMEENDKNSEMEKENLKEDAVITEKYSDKKDEIAERIDNAKDGEEFTISL